MSLSEKRIQAIALRKNGWAIKNIALELSVSKSSASVWCRDVVLSDTQIEVVMQKSNDALMKGRMLGVAMNKQKRVKAIDEAAIKAASLVGSINSRDLLMIATALYWAEGAKSIHTTGFQFINSDSDMILIMKQFLLGFGISKEDLTCTIQINELHKPRIKAVLNFWKNLLEFNDEQIGNPSFVTTQTKKHYENHDTYYGTCRLIVRKSTGVKYTMLALINALKNDIVMPV